VLRDRRGRGRGRAARRALLRAICAALTVALPAACDARSPDSVPGASADATGTYTARLDGPLLISAAASLTDAFGEIEAAFEAAHPSVEVTLNLAGSSTLRVQILEGAPVDVFASADLANMERLVEADEVAGEARVFARNRLQIAVPAGNPGRVAGVDDLAREELLLGLCAESVPCGDFARAALARAGVRPSIDTAEPDVRALLTKVALGELDAAITYVTDVSAAGPEVRGIDLPRSANLVAEYPIAVRAAAPNAAAARAFVDFVLSADGQVILERHGFLPAPGRGRHDALAPLP